MHQAIALAVAPLATKVELHETVAAAVAPLATKADVAKLATKAEMHETVATAVAQLASKADITPLATKLEVAKLATRVELEGGFAKVEASHDTDQEEHQGSDRVRRGGSERERVSFAGPRGEGPKG